MNIYFFGGSFDPPHKGHLAIIQSCVKNSQQFILIPTKQSPLKDNNPVASAKHRIRMLELLIDNMEFPIIIDDWEINNSMSNYTYDTIKYLQIKYSGNHLLMVIGGDQLIHFDKWKNYREIMDMVEIVAFNRSQRKYKQIKGMKISWIQDFDFNISSTDIRKKIAQGNLPVEELTPQILEYIQHYKLYGIRNDY